MNITEVAYAVVGSTDLSTWRRFSERNLGAMVDGDDSVVYIRIDELKYRILVIPHTEDRFLASGWAVTDFDEFVAARTHFEKHGLEIEDGAPEDCKLRAVAGFFSFQDPSGNTHEVCWGRTQVARPFISPAGVTGFMTGAMGFGHVVLPCENNYYESLDFYQRVFEFGRSDFFEMPTKNGLQVRIDFLHPANARQHSLAIGEMNHKSGLHHFMFEVKSLDDVGRQLDIALQDGLVTRALGRHVNDEMVSFYILSPGGFLVEYGYDGKQMDWEGHDVRQIPVGSYWGHQWL